MNVLTELEARLSNVSKERKLLQEEQKTHSRKASEIQKSLINLDGQEKLIRELMTVIKLKQ